MNTDDDKKVKITNLHFSHNEQQYFDQYADIEIAGCPEHNARVRERHSERISQTENALTRQQLQAINNSFQKQIDQANKELRNNKKSARTATIISVLSFVIPSLISLAALIVSILK